MRYSFRSFKSHFPIDVFLSNFLQVCDLFVCNLHLLCFFFPSFFSNTFLTEPRFNSGQFLCRHNDIPYQIRMKYKNRFENLTFDTDESGWHTDIPRLRKGKVGSQVIHNKMLFKYSLCVIGLFSNTAFREKLPYLEPKLSFLFLPGRLGSDGI